ncbi:unnamed protein product, partial [Iphiclides podalirius]
MRGTRRNHVRRFVCAKPLLRRRAKCRRLLAPRLGRSSDRIATMAAKVGLVFNLLVMLPIAKGDIPGTFFWKPRLGLDLSIPTTTSSYAQAVKGDLKPTVDEIRRGTAVLIEGYQLGVTVVALALGKDVWDVHPHLNPFRAWFYTTAYRWGLRHLALIPEWLHGTKYSYIDTHRAWRKRFHFNEKFTPKWMRWFLPHVWEWDREEKQFRRYMRYADPAFAKHVHYPGEVFDDWKSEESTETVENLDISNGSIEKDQPDY